jgi:hypothetical protein
MTQHFKQLQKVFNMLLVAQLICCTGALLFIRNSAPPTPIVVRVAMHETPTQPISTQGILALVFLLSTIIVGYLMDSQRKTQGNILQGLVEKVEHYRQSSTIRLILLQMANLSLIWVAVRENNLMYMIGVAAALLIFLYMRPAKGKFVRSYGLSDMEALLLQE